jgi:hypothetical protein
VAPLVHVQSEFPLTKVLKFQNEAMEMYIKCVWGGGGELGRICPESSLNCAVLFLAHRPGQYNTDGLFSRGLLVAHKGK